MQRRLKVFGSTHSPPPPPEAASPVEKPCHAEHEIVAQLLAEDDRGKTLPPPFPPFYKGDGRCLECYSACTYNVTSLESAYAQQGAQTLT